MNYNGEKLVDFSFCKTCGHYQEADDSDVCNFCLINTARLYSRIPVNYVIGLKEKGNKRSVKHVSGKKV